MLHFFIRRSSLAFSAAVIFVAGSVAGYWRFRQTRVELLAELATNAERCTVAFDSAELNRLSGTRTDLNSPIYAAVKDRLMRLRAVEPSVRFVYIFRRLPDASTVSFLADSEPPSSKDISLPGDEYPEAATSPGLQAILATGKPSTEGPLSDEFGTWVTGYALVGSPSAGEPQSILGLDIEAYHWYQVLWSASLGTAGYVWMLLLLPLASLVSTQRQRQHRAALRNLTEAMEQGHSAVMIVDLDRRIEYANAEFCRQLGYSRRELIGRPWREFQGFDAPPDKLAELVTTVRAGRSWAGEWLLRRKDGTHLPVRGGVTPVKNRGGHIRSFVAVFEDMTEVRKTEAFLREAKERAEAGDRAKGQFLATMSHEVRTPLNGIVGFASLLLETKLSQEQQEYVETIRTSSETLIQLTGDILDYARIESGRMKLDPQPSDARECVENALDLVAAAAVHKNIELLHWVDVSVPDAIVVDISRLRQVLVNLVNNAVKFTSDGEVEVKVRALSRQEFDELGTPKCVLEFSVRDTGIGIAAEHHARIFRAFSQVDESTTRRFGGTGLGLAICKNLVELMDGSIGFESVPDRGSTFTFTIRVPWQIERNVPLVPPLRGRRLAFVVARNGLKAELFRLAALWGADAVDAEMNTLGSIDYDLAVVDVTSELAIELNTLREPRAEFAVEKMIGLVPITLTGELRNMLRRHFRLVVNKPLHHDMLLRMLTAPGSKPTPTAMVESNAERFDLCILIVEDNPVNQRLIQQLVDKLGCTWISVANGRAAVEELRRTAPDVVLMDLHMPELDGLGATMKIRAGESGEAIRDVWIVALTADAREEQRAHTLAAGVNDYITKPVQLPELTAVLRRFVQTRRSG